MAITAEEREALRMLAGLPDGSTESVMLAHGFAIGMLRDLVRNGLATAERRKVRTGQRLIGVKWMTITDAGRRVLTGT
jgi:DNA-binding PadR family transcriptional regulator